MSDMSGFSVDCAVVEDSPGVFRVMTRREADKLKRYEDKRYFMVVKQIPRVPGWSSKDYAHQDYRGSLIIDISGKISRITVTKGNIDIQSLNAELTSLVESEPSEEQIEVQHYIYDSLGLEVCFDD